MAIRVAIRHKTVYSYDRLVAVSPHLFRLRPAVHSRTAIESYWLKIEPKEHFINCQQDPFGNNQASVAGRITIISPVASHSAMMRVRCTNS